MQPGWCYSHWHWWHWSVDKRHVQLGGEESLESNKEVWSENYSMDRLTSCSGILCGEKWSCSEVWGGEREGEIMWTRAFSAGSSAHSAEDKMWKECERSEAVRWKMTKDKPVKREEWRARYCEMQNEAKLWEVERGRGRGRKRRDQDERSADTSSPVQAHPPTKPW